MTTHTLLLTILYTAITHILLHAILTHALLLLL